MNDSAPRSSAPADRAAEVEPAGKRSFYIAGLGASAGGLEALTSFFDAMPADSGFAFVVVQHLSPDFKSQMAELLSRRTRMPVRQVENGEKVEPDRVYLIPPGKCLTIVGGKLELAEHDDATGPNLPVDLFFRSLAKDQGERAIAITLSGTGSDGTRGIRAIKEAGGMVMVQDEQSAKFDGMPGSIIATGLADFILPAAEMPAALLKFTSHPLITRVQGARLQPADGTMQKVTELLRARSGIDFSAYKQSTVVRRIERRMGVAQLTRLEDYLAVLEQSQEEAVLLGRDLLISVTRFFRDREAFAVLRETVLPAILESLAQDRVLRIWVPGCATGEEAYSIAMVVQEQLAAQTGKIAMKIFATDVDQHAVDFGGAGLYPGSIAADVSPDLLGRYFVPEGSAFRISRRIREQVIFARQNVLRDPPFTKVDLVSCRNLLIYLQLESQQKVMGLFHFALRPGGHLLLGSSEAIGERHDAFEAVDAKARIFRKRADVAPAFGRAVSGLSAAQLLRFNPAAARAREDLQAVKARQETLRESIGGELFAQFVPTCLVLNARHEVVHSFGTPERFIALRAGEASLDLIKLAPRELALALSHAIRRAEKTQGSISSPGVRFDRGGAPVVVDLTVKPLPAAPGRDALLLVLFHEVPWALNASAPPVEPSPAARSVERISDLEEDLRSARDELQSAIVDKDASSEELQAANEEMLASNEELQSSNEELESVNEELTTLNSEFQQTIAELTVSNNDLENFLRTSDVATIFLDAELRIRRFTPAVERELRVLPQDIGRLLTDLRHPVIDALAVDFPRFAAADCKPVLKTVETSPGVWHLLRITPYRREGASDQGLVVTILDVTALHDCEEA